MSNRRKFGKNRNGRIGPTADLIPHLTAIAVNEIEPRYKIYPTPEKLMDTSPASHPGASETSEAFEGVKFGRRGGAEAE